MPDSIAAGPYSATGDVVFPTVTTARRFQAGDVVFVDTGVHVDGYQSDYGHTWVVGDVNDRHREHCRTWLEIVDAVLAVAKPGATGRDLTRAAGSAYGRRPWLAHLYLAHGTGTESAEMPFVGTDLGDDFDESIVLAPGMVLVLEPVVWEDGARGLPGRADRRDHRRRVHVPVPSPIRRVWHRPLNTGSGSGPRWTRRGSSCSSSVGRPTRGTCRARTGCGWRALDRSRRRVSSSATPARSIC